MKSAVSTILILFLFIPLMAQRLTNDDLRNAIEFYNEGRFDNVIHLLNNKKYNRLNKQEESGVWKYLSAAFYEIDEIEKADSVLQKFIKKNPLYKANTTTDPEAFIAGFKRFKVKPKFSLLLSAGLNQSTFLITEKNTLADFIDYSSPYISKIGFQANFGFQRYFMYNFYLSTNINVQTIQIEREILYIDSLNTFKVSDKYIRASIPFHLIYNFKYKNLTIHPYIGIAPSYSKIITTRNSSKIEGTQPEAIVNSYNNNLKKIDSPPLTKNIFNASGILGVQVGIEKGILEYYFDFSRNADALQANIINYNRDLYYPYLYVDDKYYITNFQLSFGLKVHLNFKVKNSYAK